MIKVSNTKMYNKLRLWGKTSGFNSEAGTPKFQEIPVAEAKLVLVECDSSKEANFWVKLNNKFFKPILISLTEKIEGSDWYLHYNSGTKEYSLFKADPVFKNGNNPNDIDQRGFIVPYGNKKVLALPEHLSPQTLQDIVDGKLKDGDKVLVECRQSGFTNGNLTSIDEASHNDGIIVNVIKLNPHITIYPVEEKMIPLSKVLIAFEKANVSKINGYFVEEWFEQNVE